MTLDVIEERTTSAAGGTDHYNVNIPYDQVWYIISINANNETRGGIPMYVQVFQQAGGRGNNLAFHVSGAVNDPLQEQIKETFEGGTQIRFYFVGNTTGDDQVYGMVFRRRSIKK